MNDDADTTIDGSTTTTFRALRRPKPLVELTPGEREQVDVMDVPALICALACSSGLMESVSLFSLHILTDRPDTPTA
jgi:hypothetical protein